MPLTDIQVRNAKPSDKLYRLKDERGLFLEVPAKGSKRWRLRFSFQGKPGLLSLGTYPEISLRDARDKREEARRMLANGLNPSEVRKSQKNENQADALTFEVMFREWYTKFQTQCSKKHAEDTRDRMEKNILPSLGERPIREITSPEIRDVIERIEKRGAPEQARRLLQKTSAVFQFCEATGRLQGNPAYSLRKMIPPPKRKHHAAIIVPKGVAALMRKIENYDGQVITRYALKFAAYTFVRPGELRHAEWVEFEIENRLWRIPAHKMKMREQHLVPLSRQVLDVLKELYTLTGDGRYVFPGLRGSSRPMSENTINAALRTMGYDKTEMTGHGFRTTASTLLNEMGWTPDAIERQLAHAERDDVRGAYNAAQYLPERVKMMQAWSDYLDSLRLGAKVTTIHSKANESA